MSASLSPYFGANAAIGIIADSSECFDALDSGYYGPIKPLLEQLFPRIPPASLGGPRAFHGGGHSRSRLLDPR